MESALRATGTRTSPIPYRHRRRPPVKNGKPRVDTPYLRFARLALDWLMMRSPVPLAHLPFALAAVLVSLGSLLAERVAAAEQNSGAECAVIDDPPTRLACFDAAFPRASRASPPRQAVAPAAAAAAAATDEPPSEARKFGLSTQQRKAIEPKPAQPEMVATTAAVKTVRRLHPGYLLIELDNDQLWQQTEIDSRVWLRPGDRVTIRRAALGSYLLDTPAHFSTRVRRLH